MAKKKTPDSLNVLFIGNSFTARNDVPALIESLATARGKKFTHQLISAGGASLRMHWNKGAAQQVIAQNKFDYVVLQEQSTLPVKNAVRMHENIRLFDEVIKKSGAKTALYLTWARQNAPETQAAINEAYLSIGAELGATVIPVGIAWQNFLTQNHPLTLHDNDLSHPTLAGSYLSACVFFAELFAENPMGIKTEILSSDVITLLQKCAWGAVSKTRR